jgi:carboxymethylenebutenolidase
MCFEPDSEPPVPRIAGAAISHDDLVLEAEDGNRFAAFRAVPGSVGGEAADARAEDRGIAAGPDGPAETGIVILPDVRGLYRFYEELALRFAERGHAAVAFDYFGRTAGIEKRPDEWDYRPHVEQTAPETVQLDVGACVGHLRELGCRSIFTVGFCFGGSGSWTAAAYDHGIAGAVGFYGRPARALEFVPQTKAPILALQAGDDASISHEDNLELERALREAGVEHELVEYPAAPHSFFDRKQEQFADASEDAWRRTLEFVERHRG